MAYYTTQAAIEAQISAETVKQFADDDRDGTADSTVINGVLAWATRHIDVILKPAYPDYVPFEAGNVPEIVQEYAVDYGVFRLAGRRQKVSADWKSAYEAAKTDLEALAQPEHCLTLPDGTVIWSEGSTRADTDQAWSSTEDVDPVLFTMDSDEADPLDGFVGTSPS
jgi:phage gp36-like protein